MEKGTFDKTSGSGNDSVQLTVDPYLRGSDFSDSFTVSSSGLVTKSVRVDFKGTPTLLDSNWLTARLGVGDHTTANFVDKSGLFLGNAYNINLEDYGQTSVLNLVGVDSYIRPFAEASDAVIPNNFTLVCDIIWRALPADRISCVIQAIGTDQIEIRKDPSSTTCEIRAYKNNSQCFGGSTSTPRIVVEVSVDVTDNTISYGFSFQEDFSEGYFWTALKATSNLTFKHLVEMFSIRNLPNTLLRFLSYEIKVL